mgnify:CR=1 FL=1
MSDESPIKPRSPCECCFEREATVTLKGKYKIRVCPECKADIKADLASAKAGADERARLWQEKNPNATFIKPRKPRYSEEKLG